eukprot:213577-Rhodomonas_salina.1
MDVGGHTRRPFAAGSSRSAGDEAQGLESEAAPKAVLGPAPDATRRSARGHVSAPNLRPSSCGS